jgi:hypothetical protein
LQISLRDYIFGMKSLHLATAALEGLENLTSSSEASQAGEVSQLLLSYQRLLELADKIAPTLLIRNNSWIIQIKGLRQHYLFENEDFLTEMRTQARAALEIGKRDNEKSAVTPLFTITLGDKIYLVKKEASNSNKAISIPFEDPALVSKLMSCLK